MAKSQLFPEVSSEVKFVAKDEFARLLDVDDPEANH